LSHFQNEIRFYSNSKTRSAITIYDSNLNLTTENKNGGTTTTMTLYKDTCHQNY